MTVFHLLRHGEHSLQGKLVAGRTAGISLSERGRSEADAAAERLAGAGIHAIYASPLERAQETAAIVGQRLKLP
ncbi:MAG TPA: histidine phosphatase family protein, partial [Stellaceae bacterium]|nr:histidine phosphatase family protein [Stellaceae bacterium]